MGYPTPFNDTVADPTFETAEEVSDWLLKVTRDAYFERDFEKFAQRSLLPQRIGNFDGEQVIRTEAELRHIYNGMLDHFQIHGVSDLKRRTIAAEFLSPTEIRATFVTQHVLRGYALSEEIVVHGIAKLVDGLWKISDASYATNIERVSRALTPKQQDV